MMPSNVRLLSGAHQEAAIPSKFVGGDSATNIPLKYITECGQTSMVYRCLLEVIRLVSDRRRSKPRI